jgi:hypothetical protein
MKRCDVGGQVALAHRFFCPIEINIIEQGVSPFAVTSILNRERPAEEVIVQQRRKNFDAEVDRVRKGRTRSDVKET